MNELFRGLLLYEIVLLVLGVFLFLILSAGLLYYIIKKEQIKKLLLFFVLPILMIGYPSIQEISISKDRIQLTKYQEQFLQNPEDSVARENVEKYTDKLKDRASSKEDIVQISKSQLLLGNYKQAADLADKAVKKKSSRESVNIEAKNIRSLATLENAVQEQSGENTFKIQFDSIKHDLPVTKDIQKLKPFLSQKAIIKLNDMNK